MGLKADFSPREVKSMRAMDPFFLQAAASENDTFMYFSGTFHRPGFGFPGFRLPYPYFPDFFHSPAPIRVSSRAVPERRRPHCPLQKSRGTPTAAPRLRHH